MAFEYGSDSIEIPNPFIEEGRLYIISGVICSIIGLVSLFTLRGQILQYGLSNGWVKLIISLALLGLGARYTVSGLFKVFRFYVGRGMPASLSQNVAPSEYHLIEPELMYNSQDLNQMLMGRKNPTFVEPKSLVDQFVYNMYPTMIFLPYPIRNSVHTLLSNAAYTVMFFVIYLLSMLSSSIGLTTFADTTFTNWIGICFAIILFTIWKPKTKNISNLEIQTLNLNSFVILAAIAILVPVIGELALKNGIAIPRAPLDPFFYIFLILCLTIVAVVSTVAIVVKRSEMFNPKTEVSEYRSHWQENVHPKDIFICFDMEMANLRYKDIPNRTYREIKPELKMEGSLDKGGFIGDGIQETQPEYEEIKYTDSFKKLRLGIAIYGHAIISLAALLLFVMNINANYVLSVKTFFNSFYTPAILWFFGTISANVAHLCWAEMHFKSYLIHFKGEGTYTESKLSVGMAITDSTRSENTVVRTSFTPWIIVSEVLTSTIAGVGSKSLEGARYVLNMKNADNFLDIIVNGIRVFLENRQLIAKPDSAEDVNSIGNYYSMNKLSVANNLVKALGISLPTDNEGKQEIS